MRGYEFVAQIRNDLAGPQSRRDSNPQYAILPDVAHVGESARAPLGNPGEE
jgi:hypothetical protein